MEAYLRTFNASESAREAGYKNAGTTGWRVLRRCQEKGFFSKELDKRAMPANEVLARLTEQAKGDIADIVRITDDGRVSVYDLQELQSMGLSRLIKSIKQTKDGLQVELYDAQAALVQLGRAHGLFIDKVAPTDPTGKKPYEQRPDLSKLTVDDLELLAGIAGRLNGAEGGAAEAEPE